MQTTKELYETKPALDEAPEIAHSKNGVNGVSKSLPFVSRKVNILMVDDRDDKLLALEAVLGTLGENLVKAKSGKEALRHLLKDEFAVILLDVSMPGMDGFETASMIRKRPSTEHTPIIFVTSIGNSPSQMYQGYSLGAVDYILTPIVPDVLRAKVCVFVDLWKKTEQVKQQAERLRQIEEAEHQRKLAEAEDRLEAETKRNRFFTLALDMLGIADFEGRLLQLNPTWEKTLGYSEDELKSFSGLDLVHPDERASMQEKMNRLKNGASAAYFEGRYLHKDGSFRWLGWTAAPFPAEKLLYIFARDITAQKQAEAQIQTLNGQLEQRVKRLTEVNGELEAFSYSISHDLRAPLRSMCSFSQALLLSEKEKLSQHGLDYTNRIIRSAKYMDNLLQDMLTYSRVARTELTMARVDLDDLVNEVVAQFEGDIRDKHVQIEVQPALGSISADVTTVKQILSNLIGNSLKFISPERAPTLRISSEARENFTRLSIEDNGIGISSEHHEKIFGLFERLHDATAYPGTGIGLALVRKGAERIGGRVGLKSELGKGCRFWVDFQTS
jgi:PAS domain S-box-containing protein